MAILPRRNMPVYGRQEVPGAGLPGAPQPEGTDPKVAAMLLTRDAAPVITQDDVRKATELLRKYKDGKANLEARVVEDEQWWQLRHWDAIRGGKTVRPGETPEPSSAWLFNAILTKHADAMDNYPEPVVLPREPSDADSANILSEVLPVVMERNEFEDTYSGAWWEKLKHGTAAYGVFWDNGKENGLGDIDIRAIDLLKLFWEPGIQDIQDSANLFVVDLVDTELLDQQYPQYAGKMSGNAVDVKQYQYDDTVDTEGKSVVIDWYYKVKSADSRTILHYVKFVGDTLLYASENDPAYRERGFYDHGLYPVVLDCMFPEKGTPIGFGYVAICKDPQLYIDKLSANILESAMMGTKKRYFVSAATNVNEQEFLDWTKPIVRVEGEISDARIREIVTQPISDIYVSVVNQKIDEMKETAANRDMTNGGTASGVTAASAIAALQEAGNKASRDMIAASYRTYTRIAMLCIELMRQFYTEGRAFRVAAPNGLGYEFVQLDNSGLQEHPIGTDAEGVTLFRRPIFDLKIKAQKRNPFSRMEMNETAKELYSMGFFSPDRAQEALIALNMMEFEGIDDVRQQVQQGMTLLNLVQQLAQENSMLKAALGLAPPQTAPDGGNAGRGQGAPNRQAAPSGGLASAATEAQTPMTSYGQRLAARSVPNMAVSPNAANPGR